jgi:GNAT superfamily N-acetyltransferase
MARRLVNITLDNLDDLRLPCRACAFWELDPIVPVRGEEPGDARLEKEAWVSATLLEWGSCGKLLYVDADPVAYVLYAPPAFVPRSAVFATSPVSADAVLLMTGAVLPAHRGGGLARMLVQGVAKDLTRRGIRAIEAFGDARSPEVGPDGAEVPRCVVPADFLLAVGFKTVRPHPRFPRLRLELRGAVSWREDMEVALERLLGSMAPEPALRPV